MPDHQRADARRNYARILEMAEREVALHGAGASLEQIAREAGVGSATVRRHLPTRRALLEAVSQTRVKALCDRAHALTDKGGPDALLEWLRDVVAYCVSARGLASALAYHDHEAEPAHGNSCSAALEEAARPLLHRAVQDGSVSSGVTVTDLISLAVGVTLATEHHPDPANQADRLFQLTIAGISPKS